MDLRDLYVSLLAVKPHGASAHSEKSVERERHEGLLLVARTHI